MKDLDKVNELIKKGYHIEVSWPIKNITKEAVDNFFSQLSLKTNLDVLLDPSNDDAYLILFRNMSKEFEREEIVTSDKDAIYRVEEHLSFQNQPVGIWINATCAVLGSSSKDERVFYLDNLIPYLNNIFGWKFRLNDIPGTFNAEIKINSTDKVKEQKALRILQNFLDAISIAKNVGFHIQYYVSSPIPRHKGPYAGGMGPCQQMVPPLTQFEADKIIKIMKSNENVKIAARGLNQSYVENLLPSRVARLWATIEHIFDTKPKPMLKRAERKAIMRSVKKMENLDIKEKDIEKMNFALSNLHLESRNERIAKNISSLMNISFNEAYDKVKNASLTRGKNVHRITNDWKKLEETEKFLQEVLHKVIENNMNGYK